MSKHNVIPFTKNRGFDKPSRTDGSPEDPNELLRVLRNKKRLSKTDQATLVDNLGQLVVEFDADNAKTVAQNLLERNERDKRKRYIRLPDDRVSERARHAASGGSFARIIEQLIKLHSRKNVDQETAKIAVVRQALRNTSFRPSPPFRMPAGSDKTDVIQLATDMQAMSDRLSDETNFADLLALLAKHPIFPNEAWYQWTNQLELKANLQANSLYEWGSDLDDYELNEWIPWWAPRCLIGHLYVPFSCRAVHVARKLIPEILTQQKTTDVYPSLDYYSLIEPYIDEQQLKASKFFHRLPVWLVVLPLPNKLVPCLYAATHHPGGFYPGQQYPRTNSSLHPFFVSTIGADISNDAILLPDADNDDLNTCYVVATASEVIATGSRIDEKVRNFNCECQFASMPSDLPEWLEERPVQRFLKLTDDDRGSMSYALAPRLITNGTGKTEDGTVFRPTFPDAGSPYTGLRHNSIAAYLLRNLISNDTPSIYSSLRDDIVAKRNAAQLLLRESIKEYREKFKQRYEK